MLYEVQATPVPAARDAPVRRLNVGCGTDIRPASEGWVNMDVVPLPGVDVVHDLFELPLPFPDASFDHILCSHILEHVPHRLGGSPKDGLVQMVEEFHRVLRPGGILEVLAPHPDCVDAWADPTHTRIVHPRTFEYFTAESRFNYYTTARFRVRVVEVTKYSLVAPDFLRLGKSRLGLFSHLAARFRFLHPLLYRRPYELRVVVEKAG